MRFFSEHPVISFIILFFIFIPLLIGGAFYFYLSNKKPFTEHVNESVSNSYYYSKKDGMITYSLNGFWFEVGAVDFSVDMTSFQTLGQYFAQDKNHLYYENHIIDDEVDKETFRADQNNPGLVYDKNGVYLMSRYHSENWREDHQNNQFLVKIENANPTTFIDSIAGYEEDYFLKEVEDPSSGLIKIPHHPWSKDDKHIFYEYKVFDIDYSSFEILNSHFVKDAHHVYYIAHDGVYPTQEIDASSAKALNDRYIFDQNNIYDYQEYVNNNKEDYILRIPYEDIENVYIRESKYLFVNDTIFYDGKEIDGAEVGSFKVIATSSQYAMDAESVYQWGKKIEQADPHTFELVDNYSYSKDSQHVFFDGKIIQGADTATFKKVKDRDIYKDKNHVYEGGKIVER